MIPLRAGGQDRRGRWWWLAALILVPVVLGSALSVVLLLTLVDAATAGDQIELIKTGLAVGAGTGGAVALVLAGRRQWSTEQAHRLTERSAADVRHDATERRITDLYSKAADQLGSEKAAVRLAGLYSLERLAQNTPPLRQTIVNLLCAYLRMPSEAPSEQEIEVRVTAQRILATHLRPGNDPEHPQERFWPDIDLHLTGAVLQRFDLTFARLGRGEFGGARFVGWASFDATRFDGPAIFGGAQFGSSVNFRASHFAVEARFRGATFVGPAAFDDAAFDSEALFGGERDGQPDAATFEGTVSFAGARFALPPVIDSSIKLH
ncbi:pentapeptide repeat-containing protein [Actinophytocola oryzae]|uniref:Pentapeptide repeat protein n=1 Tax=Actinophytocola oryzae TaxID=502181 RepID=A0A4R7VIH8_9PSEU|nr:pentapeptide repeat-containing protein [Actinophytocola oryzae]TDV48919.1 hypothetical protein CLV71_108280 [Actinophytocola oryzae]